MSHAIGFWCMSNLKLSWILRATLVGSSCTHILFLVFVGSMRKEVFGKPTFQVTFHFTNSNESEWHGSCMARVLKMKLVFSLNEPNKCGAQVDLLMHVEFLTSARHNPVTRNIFVSLVEWKRISLETQRFFLQRSASNLFVITIRKSLQSWMQDGRFVWK